MQNNLDLVNYGISHTTSVMLERLKKGIQDDTLEILPNKKKVDFLFPTFEIFSFLLFQLDYLVVQYQEQKLREPLFNFIVDNMFKALHIKEKFFVRILNKRMEEYGGIKADAKLTNDLRQQRLAQSFVDNLAYSIFEKNLFDWEGEIKPVPLLDALKVFAIYAIYSEELLPVEATFLIIQRNLFAANSDFTRLSRKELENIQKINEKELKEKGLLKGTDL